MKPMDRCTKWCVIELAARLMSCHFPGGVSPETVAQIARELTGQVPPYPIPPDGYFPLGVADPRLFVAPAFRSGPHDIDVVFRAEDGTIHRVACEHEETAKAIAEEFVSYQPPYPDRWREYSALLRLRRIEQMNRHESSE